MKRPGLRQTGVALSLVLAFALLIAGFGIARAQDTDVTLDGPGTARPGHIHEGTCADGGLGDVVYPLNNATVDNLPEDYAEGDDDVTFGGSEDATAVYASTTTVDASLDSIATGEYAINFHLSADEITTYIACGEIGGFVRDGVLYVGLTPVEGSTGGEWAGTAVLSDNGDDTTDVVVQIVQLSASTSAAPAVSTPIATDASADASVAASADEPAASSASGSASGSAAASASGSATSSASGSDAPSASGSAAASGSASASASTAPSDDESAASSASGTSGGVESEEPSASPS